MATRIQNIFRVRSLLDNPYPSAPDFHALVQLELSAEADILNATSNTDKPWAIDTYQLNYTPGQQSYPIEVTNFGKAYLVTRIVPGPYITRINVPFDDLDTQQYGAIWPWYGNGGPWMTNSTAEKMSFFREGVTNSQISVTIQPQPQQACTYEITFIPGTISGDDPLETSIQLPEHAELVQLRVAVSALPYCKWHEDEAMNQMKRKELAAAFAYQLDRKEAIFRTYISSIAIPKSVEIDDWAGSSWY